MEIPRLAEAGWSRLYCPYSWELFPRSPCFSLSSALFFPVSGGKEQDSTFSSWQPRIYEETVVMFPLRFSFPSIKYASSYSLSHRSYFLDLWPSLLLSSVLSPMALLFHQTLRVKLDIVLMPGFNRVGGYSLGTDIFLFFIWLPQECLIFLRTLSWIEDTKSKHQITEYVNNI